MGNRPQQKNKGLCILAVHSFFYDMRERKENGRKKYEEEFFRSGLKVPDRNIDHLCGTDSSRGCCGNGKTGVAGEYDHQPDPCCPTVVSDRHAGIDRAGKTDAGGSTCEKSMKPGQFILALIMCFALMYCGNLVGTLITTIVGALKGSAVDNALMTYATESNMIVTFIYMVICAPILEEYIFRKLIVDRTVKYGQGVAIALSGLMFGLFHGNLNQFAYAMLLGMFLAFLYVKTGNLKITIGLHMCINFMGAVVSVLLLKAIHLDEYQEIVMNGGDAQAVMDFMMAYLPGWIGYMVYVLFILAVVITGIVLFIVFRKRFALDPGQIPKGQRFKTVICNPGMLCYCIFWIVMILLQMFPEIVQMLLEISPLSL